MEIVLRADSGFCRWRMLRRCDQQARYVVRIARNAWLSAQREALRTTAEQRFSATGRKQRLLGSLHYAAHSWDRARRVIVKAEHSSFGSNPRFAVTNLPYGDTELETATPMRMQGVRVARRGRTGSARRNRSSC